MRGVRTCLLHDMHGSTQPSTEGNFTFVPFSFTLSSIARRIMQRAKQITPSNSSQDSKEI